MNELSIALLGLLSKCKQEDTELSREFKVQQILNSMDYKDLKNRKIFAPQFNKLFSEKRIREMDETQLQVVSEVLPLIPSCLEDILFSISNGEAYALTKADTPDFLDAASLKKLSFKLSKATGKNITNIDSDDFMSIFSPDTVKHCHDIYMSLDIDEDYKESLNKVLNGKKYCIHEKELQECESEYYQKITSLKNKEKSLKEKIISEKNFKLFLGIVLLCIPPLISHYSIYLTWPSVLIVEAISLLVSVVIYFLG